MNFPEILEYLEEAEKHFIIFVKSNKEKYISSITQFLIKCINFSNKHFVDFSLMSMDLVITQNEVKLICHEQCQKNSTGEYFKKLKVRVHSK